MYGEHGLALHGDGDATAGWSDNSRGRHGVGVIAVDVVADAGDGDYW